LNKSYYNYKKDRNFLKSINLPNLTPMIEKKSKYENLSIHEK